MSGFRENGGSISFERFMEMALYEPGLGYYSAGATRFGAAGDFITAPHVSPLYSHCLARQCRQILAALSGGDILELGAGSGLMAQGHVAGTGGSGQFCRSITLYWKPARILRRRQQELFSSRIPHLLPRITWLETLPEQPLSGVIIANEVVDALPVSRVALNKGELHELCVGHDGDDFFWIEAPLRG